MKRLKKRASTVHDLLFVAEGPGAGAPPAPALPKAPRSMMAAIVSCFETLMVNLDAICVEIGQLRIIQ